MTKRLVSIPIAKYSVETINNDIAKVSINVFHTKTNYNGSYFEEESIDNSKDSFALKPIVAAYDFDEDGEINDFKEHNEDESPIGCIRENNNFSINEIEGKPWVTVEGVVFKEYCPEAYKLLLDNQKKISMEIEVIEGQKNKNDKLYHIKKFNLLAITILGDNIPPAMGNNATITMFSKIDSENFIAKFSKIISKSKEILDNKGGEELNRDKIIEKFSNVKDYKNYSEIINNTSLSDEDLKKQLFSLSQYQLRERISEAVTQKKMQRKIVGEYGIEYKDEVPKYWLEEIIQDDKLVILYDKEDGKYYGYNYTINGDLATIDFENGTRYVIGEWRPYQEGNSTIEPIKDNYSNEAELVKTVETFMQEEIKNKVDEAVNKTKKEFNIKETKEFKELQQEKEVLANEVKDLKQFKAEVEQAKKEEEYSVLFKKYSYLKEFEEYSTLEKNRFDFSLENLEKELKVLAFDNKQSELIKKFNKEFNDPLNFPLDNVKNRTEDAQEDFYVNRYGDVSEFKNR